MSVWFAPRTKTLEKLVVQNEFREDLLFRLNVFPIEVPSLKERREDIPDLIDFFLQKKFFQSKTTQRPFFDESGLAKLKKLRLARKYSRIKEYNRKSLRFFPKR